MKIFQKNTLIQCETSTANIFIVRFYTHARTIIHSMLPNIQYICRNSDSSQRKVLHILTYQD